MANVAHSTLTGSNLHENKGVATASANQVATADGAGNTVWKVLNASNVAGTANPFGAQLLHARYEVSPGIGGQTWTSSAWNTQSLNTVKLNQISGASLFSNAITLPAGTYRVQASVVQGYSISGSASLRAKLRIRNTTTGNTIAYGQNAVAGASASTVINGNFAMFLFETFVLSGTSTVELQGWSQGLFAPIADSSGENEVYADLMIWKIL